MQDGEVEITRLPDDCVAFDLMRRRVDQFGIRHHGRELREPGRIPVRFDFPLRLVARAGASVETLERGRLQKQGAHKVFLT